MEPKRSLLRCLAADAAAENTSNADADGGRALIVCSIICRGVADSPSSGLSLNLVELMVIRAGSMTVPSSWLIVDLVLLILRLLAAWASMTS